MPNQPAGRVGPGIAPQTPAERYLESLQQRVYQSLGLTADDCQRRELAGQQVILPARLQQKALELSDPEFHEYRAALLEGLTRDEQAPRPTRFERPHQYSILRDLKAAIERAATRLGVDLPVTPVIGTLPTRQLEPLMLPVPGTIDEVVLVVDGQLLTYANLLAKAVAQALPVDTFDGAAEGWPETGGWDALVDPDGAATRRFLELMFAAVSSTPGHAPSYLPETSYEHVAGDLCESMELFLVGREYARLCEGDHLLARPQPRVAHGETFEALAWTGEQEEKADCLGLALMLVAADDNGQSLRWAYWSADVLLESFGLIRRTHDLLACQAAEFFVAPPVNPYDTRRRLLREMMLQWEGGHLAVSFADAMRPVMRVLGDRLEAALCDLRFGTAVRH